MRLAGKKEEDENKNTLSTRGCIFLGNTEHEGMTLERKRAHNAQP